MQPSLSNSSNISRHASFSFQWLCEEFHIIQNNHKHLRAEHQATNTIISSDGQVIRQNSLSNIPEKAQQQSETLNYEVTKIEDQKSDNIPIPNHQLHQLRSKEQRKKNIQTLLKGRYIKKDYEFRSKSVCWQGFKLIKNYNCQYEPYYCGKCKQICFQIEDYIEHCLQLCQTLIHEDSSHTITLKQEKEETSEDLSDIKEQDTKLDYPDNPEQRTGNSSNNNNQLCEQQPQQSQNNQVQDYYPIFTILYKLQDHRNLPFSCGNCSAITFETPFQYKRHLLKHHSKQLSLSSSHAVLSLQTKRSNFYLYMCQLTQWHHNLLIYVCPCSKDNKMSMKDLVRHIISVHSGISPIYHQEIRKNTFHKIIRNQQRIIPDSMKQLRKSGVDHKDVPFRCHPCKIQLKNALQYKIHVRDLHQNKIHPSSSHIILRFKRQRRNHRRILLISPHSSQIKKVINQRSVYYCPCQPGNKITMEALIQHIIQKHQGVSPEYAFNGRVASKEFVRTQRSQSTGKVGSVIRRIDYLQNQVFSSNRQIFTISNNARRAFLGQKGLS